MSKKNKKEMYRIIRFVAFDEALDKEAYKYTHKNLYKTLLGIKMTNDSIKLIVSGNYNNLINELSCNTYELLLSNKDNVILKRSILVDKKMVDNNAHITYKFDKLNFNKTDKLVNITEEENTQSIVDIVENNVEIIDLLEEYGYVKVVRERKSTMDIELDKKYEMISL